MDIAAIEQKLAECEDNINSLKSAIDQLMSELKVQNTQIETSSNRVISTPTYNPNYVPLYYSGSNYNVVNTPNISVLDLAKFIQQYRIYQRAHANRNNFGNRCLGVAKAYGRSLMMGKIPKNIDSFYGGAYTYFDGGKGYKNKEEALRVIYQEISNGRPCVVKVTTKAGTRHFATVVGIKNHVSSASELKEEDLLIIDAWDGKLEAMDNSETADRHLFNDGKGYRVDRLLPSKLSARK